MLDYHRLLQHEENLDPANWDDLRQLGHQMIDDMMDYLQHIGERPVWQPTPESTKQLLKSPLPTNPETPGEVYAEFKTHILPYPKGNIHPRFWSWVQGGGTPFAMLAELLAAGMNPNVAIGDHAAMYVEQQVIDWCKAMLKYPPTASGILVSGGTLANFTALIVARNAYDARIREKGLRAVPGQLVLYASTEAHVCMQKAAEVIGLGREAVRQVRVDGDFRMDVDHLKQMIAADRAAGMAPFCVVGNAGAVNTGAIDPLADILAVCREEKLWFHVDGAFGALAKLVPEYQDRLAPIEQADSVAFDLHKWICMPYEVGCVLVKDAALHRSRFRFAAQLPADLSGWVQIGRDFGASLSLTSATATALRSWCSIWKTMPRSCEQARKLGREFVISATKGLFANAPAKTPTAPTGDIEI
jgi:aromatic-L-amino-acid decarboxylase